MTSPDMPVYEFDCEQCGRRFEELLSGGAARSERLRDACKRRGGGGGG